MKVKVSDVIAQFLESKGTRHVFGIIGSGIAHIFDSIYYRGFTEIVCVHQEQAACMAAQGYYRTNNIVSAALLTTGGGSLNGITGVVSAWADSIPLLIISSNENSKHTRPENPLRMWGVQGYNSTEMVKQVTKYQARVMDPTRILYEIEKAYYLATTGRPGPVWVDVPINVQSMQVEETDLVRFDPNVEFPPSTRSPISDKDLEELWKQFSRAERPLLWLGHGIRLAGAVQEIPALLSHSQIPALLSWAGADMVESDHPLIMGRAGLYGQRAANLILQNCDFLVTIGTRLAIPQIGYEISELCRSAKIFVVDIDSTEAKKYPERMTALTMDAGEFIRRSIQILKSSKPSSKNSWINYCNQTKRDFPLVGPEHADKNGFINSYAFMEKINPLLSSDQVVVTDMGTALLCAHPILQFQQDQRLITSTGLGEMGYGLPAAIGASFARNKGEVLCLNCDGGMMMNLQELQTMVHHQLPIKLVIFNNDGYLMIKHTQKAFFGNRYAGTNRATGLSCPDFSKVAAAFNIPSFSIKTWEDVENVFTPFLQTEGPAICEVFMDPEQLFVPKLAVATKADGTLVSPPLEDLSPLLDREELKKHMLISLHPKSEALKPAPSHA